MKDCSYYYVMIFPLIIQEKLFENKFEKRKKKKESRNAYWLECCVSEEMPITCTT